MQGVDFLQVVQCGPGRFNHVSPLVHPPVLREFINAAGGWNELPKASSLRVRGGLGVVGALYNGKQGKLHRQSTCLDFFNNMVQVRPSAREDPVEVVGVRGKPFDKGLNTRTWHIGHGKARPNSIDQVVVGWGCANKRFGWVAGSWKRLLRLGWGRYAR